ncbi:hypothetical protein ACFYN3_42185 [Streptomyces lavendulae]|uniref:hypothetical protein n=1 Tax=Streptomyces lavendulae TaxID=1914 RepID=UPI0034040EFD
MLDTDARSAVSGKVLSHAIWAEDGGELARFYAAALGAQVAEPYRDEHGRPAAFPGVGRRHDVRLLVRCDVEGPHLAAG